MVPTKGVDDQSSQIGPTFINIEATVSSDKVKTHMSTLWMLDSLQSALQLLYAETDCRLSTYDRKTEDSKSWRQGWQAVMLESPI